MYKRVIVDYKKRVRYASIIGLTLAITWLGFWSYCVSTSPKVPNIETNETYEINNHGTKFYLNQTKYIILYAIPSVALLLSVSSMLFVKYENKPKSN